MSKSTNHSNDDILLEKLLSEKPGRAKRGIDKKKLISVVTIVIGLIAFIASISQIAGVTIKGFFEEVPVDEALRLDYQYRCSGEGVINDTISGNKRLGV